MPAAIVERDDWSQSLLLSPSLCDPAAKSIRLDEVRESSFAVDLDDRQPLAVPGLEVEISPDVDLCQLELQLGTKALDDSARGGTEVAAFGVVEDDPGYG